MCECRRGSAHTQASGSTGRNSSRRALTGQDEKYHKWENLIPQNKEPRKGSVKTVESSSDPVRCFAPLGMWVALVKSQTRKTCDEKHFRIICAAPSGWEEVVRGSWKSQRQSVTEGLILSHVRLTLAKPAKGKGSPNSPVQESVRVISTVASYTRGWSTTSLDSQEQRSGLERSYQVIKMAWDNWAWEYDIFWLEHWVDLHFFHVC